MKVRFITKKVLILLVSCLAALVVAVGTACSSKAPSTLEEYLDANPAAWNELESSFVGANHDDIVLDTSISASGNEITMSAKYDLDVSELDESIVASMPDVIDSYFSDADMAPAVADIEKSTGIEGVTVHFYMTDRNGNELAAISYDANGRIK